MDNPEPTTEELDRLFALVLAEHGGQQGTQRYAESERVLRYLRELRRRELIIPRGQSKATAAALGVRYDRMRPLLKAVGMDRSATPTGEWVSCAYCFKLFWLTRHQLAIARGNIKQGTVHADWMPTCSTSCAIRRAKTLRGQNGRSAS